MTKNLILAAFLGLIIIFGSSLVIHPLQAQGNILPEATGSVAPAACTPPAGSDVSAKTYCGNYALNDFLSLAVNISRWILGIVGSLTLAMFLFGGVTLLLSGGSSEKVDKAKKAMVASVIGLIIVFSSYLIIKEVMRSFGLNWDGSTNKPTPIIVTETN